MLETDDEKSFADFAASQQLMIDLSDIGISTFQTSSTDSCLSERTLHVAGSSSPPGTRFSISPSIMNIGECWPRWTPPDDVCMLAEPTTNSGDLNVVSLSHELHDCKAQLEPRASRLGLPLYHDRVTATTEKARGPDERHQPNKGAPVEIAADKHKRKAKRNSCRPAHNHGDAAVDVLKQWFLSNISSPFPCNLTKEELAQKSGITTRQVSTWMTNERKRVFKPLRISVGTELGRPPLQMRNRLGKDLTKPTR